MATKLKLKANPVHLRAYGAGVPIRLSAEAADDGPVWIQVAKEGKWKGHLSGRLIEFTAKTFEQLITNLHAHPAFEAGEDGLGKAKVVPFDYEHASEMKPTDGSLPVTGAPAPAWCLDLQTRKGEDGLELWSWTQLGPKAREQIRAEEYQWTSVAVWANAKDHVTGTDVGPVLTSIAFTNHPFIQGMAPMQASVSIYGKAESPEEVIVGVRDLLGLPPDSAREAVVLELEALRSAMSDGRSGPGYPDGYGWLVDSVRRLLGLRVLATTDEIINSAGQVIGAVADPNATATPPPKDPTMTQPASTLSAQLADLLNCRDTEQVLLAAVAKEKAKGDSLDQLLALFDSDDMGALLKDAATTIEKAKKADEYLAGLNAAREKLGAGEKKEAEAEVEQIAASMGLTGKTAESFKPLLLNARLACNDADPTKAAQLLSEFRTRYPLPDPGKQLLTQQVVAGPNGSQLGGAHTALPGAGSGSVQQQVPAHVQLFSAYPGNNDIEKAIAYHREKTPGFDRHPYQTQVRAASGFVRTGQLSL